MSSFEDTLSESTTLTPALVDNHVALDILSESGELSTDYNVDAALLLSATVSATDVSLVRSKLFDTLTLLANLTATEAIAWGFDLSERVSGTTDLALNSVYSDVEVASIGVRETLVFAWSQILAEAATITDSSTGKFEVATELVERIRNTDTNVSLLQAVALVSAAILVTEVVEGGQGGDLVESVTITPELVDRYLAICSALENAQMTATAAATAKISVPLSVTATITDSTSLRSILKDVLTEGLFFELAFTAGSTSYRGWCMNMQNFAVTEYQNYPFNSMVKFQGLYLGANDNGVYRLDGDTDAGEDIDARIKTGILGFRNQTRMDSAYLTMRTDGEVLLKVVTAEKTENWYSLKGSDNLSQKRVKFGRGIQSSLYQFELTNISGADLELSAMELIPVMLSRKGD